jgi:hypothetical protein
VRRLEKLSRVQLSPTNPPRRSPAEASTRQRW